MIGTNIGNDRKSLWTWCFGKSLDQAETNRFLISNLFCSRHHVTISSHVAIR